MHTGLEISGFALPNVNQFKAKCKSLPFNDLQYMQIS